MNVPLQTRTCSASSTARSWPAACCTPPAVGRAQGRAAGRRYTATQEGRWRVLRCTSLDGLPAPALHIPPCLSLLLAVLAPCCPLVMQLARTTRRACSPASSSSVARSLPARCAGWGSWASVAGQAGSWLVVPVVVVRACSMHCRPAWNENTLPAFFSPCHSVFVHVLPCCADGGHGERPADGQGAGAAV